MGVISRKVFPACGSMCVCCPALRSNSRHPVKRYRKLLAEIFPKTLDSPPNDRKIGKLCEYASKNPLRIPKIAKYLEERCYKELQSEDIKFINVVAEAYNGLLHVCRDQMAYYAVSLLNVVAELLDNSKHDSVQILGCQILTRFICCQTDGIYTHNIEVLVHKVCILALEDRGNYQRRSLSAASLQCLSAVVWFMAEFSTTIGDFNEIVHVILNNYEKNMHNENGNEIVEPHRNWVNEVVRCDGRAGAGFGSGFSLIPIRPKPEKKDPSLLTREESETPKVWTQICIQRMAELAKESTTMRQILDPMFVYFDTGCHWASRKGLAMMVLSDMSYFVETTGNPQFILSAVVRHLDHKSVSHDPLAKSNVIQAAATLARQIRSQLVLSEAGFVSDLCRHLRKSLQAMVESIGGQDSQLNVSLQHSIEDCLLEIVKGIGDARLLYDLMVVTLEKLPSVGVVARATIGSLIILARTISMASISSHTQQVFPEALLVQLLKAMLHPDVEARVGAHQILSALLIPTPHYPKHDASMLCRFHEPQRCQSNISPAFSSITALLEKLRQYKDGAEQGKYGSTIQDENIEAVVGEEEVKQGWPHKNSPSLYELSSIVDKRAGPTCIPEPEPFIMKFSGDQISQLLSGFWVQAILPDNLPSNFEAISHSFSLMLIAARLENPKSNLVIRFFQLPLSLRNISLGPSNGMLPSSRLRSVLALSTALLMFAVKIHHIPQVNELLKSLVPHDVDSYVRMSDDLQVYAKPQMDMRQYGSFTDNQAAAALLLELRDKICESDMILFDILTPSLSAITELEADELARQLSEPFTPDDAFMFGPQSILDSGHLQLVSQSTQSLSFDGDFPANSALEDDAKSEFSIADVSRFVPKMSVSPSASQIISIGKLMESALEVAGQVAGSCVSTSPLPYSTMASHCEALGTGTKRKLSSWLDRENNCHAAATNKPFLALPPELQSAMRKIASDDGLVQDETLPPEPWMTVRLPPASPFDNFLRAARY